MRVQFTGDPSGEGTNPVAVQFGGEIFPLHKWVDLPAGFDPIVARKLANNAHFETQGEPLAMPGDDADAAEEPAPADDLPEVESFADVAPPKRRGRPPKAASAE